MAQIGLPKFVAPRLVTPKSLSPEDVVAAAAATDESVLNSAKTFVESMGLPAPPVVPTPAMVLSQVIKGVGGGKGEATTKTRVIEETVKAREEAKAVPPGITQVIQI